MTVIVDGTSYNINAIKVQRLAEFLDLYAERTQDGVLHRQLIGVYYNWKMTIAQPDSTQLADYQAFWAVITEATPFHSVTVPNTTGFDYTFTAYIANVQDNLVISTRPEGNYWDGLTVDFIAQSPAATP